MTLLLQLQVAATETPAMGAEFRRYAESRWLAQRCNPDPLHQQRTSLLHRLRQTVNDFPSSSGIATAAAKTPAVFQHGEVGLPATFTAMWGSAKPKKIAQIKSLPACQRRQTERISDNLKELRQFPRSPHQNPNHPLLLSSSTTVPAHVQDPDGDDSGD
ncbi:hypothetical protein MRB53_035507 [Persea americana]|uniref:Uncharacterized protein n=1 Tax=Persea americana TaxID=3435 RepID=A0ACC2K4T3_PERAE|nr:hypothetical protein MRB53_035507 [Persea americana]